MEHEEQKISRLATGDKILLAGHVAATLSTLLIGIGSVLKAAGRLPGLTIGAVQSTQSQTTATTSKNYFDIN